MTKTHKLELTKFNNVLSSNTEDIFDYKIITKHRLQILKNGNTILRGNTPVKTSKEEYWKSKKKTSF